MIPIILFRQDPTTEEEFNVVKEHFEVVETRGKIPAKCLVIPRYSALPYYKELEQDVLAHDSTLINTTKQFNWIADFQYYETLEQYTFKTYFDAMSLPDDMSFVVKGKTNSRKHQWNTMCFAKDRRRAIEIACDLRNDGLVGQQDIIFREYCPLVTYEHLLNGLPVTNEWRVFFYKGKMLVAGYYWTNAENPEKARFTWEANRFAKDVASHVKDHNNFFVVDIAQKIDGSWIMVELNAGEMSGTSMCSLQDLYAQLDTQLIVERYPFVERYPLSF